MEKMKEVFMEVQEANFDNDAAYNNYIAQQQLLEEI